MTKFCGQCGQPWAAQACGPSHAIVFREHQLAALRRLKARLRTKLAPWFMGDDLAYIAKEFNAAIDAWAAAERRKGDR